MRSWAAALGKASAEELREFDPRAYVTALKRTASRVALLYTGDPHGALAGLSALARDADEAAVEPAQALSLPDLRDVALFALSDLYLESRGLLVA